MRACLLQPDFLLVDGRLLPDVPLGVDEAGRVCAPADVPASAPRLRLEGRALLPGMVNAHSHAFQRLIRGRTELLTPGHVQDDFWSWRERMYLAANAMTPEDVHVASRQAFLEMVLGGITTVGEFHYLHHQADGTPYVNRSELALQVIRAAREVGLRIVLLRVAYARAGFELASSPLQRRFYEPDVDTFLAGAGALRAQAAGDPLVQVGLAPHSVRAVPRAWLRELAQVKDTVLHMHVAEQPAEIAACEREHGLRPVALLAELGLLSPRFTAVHGVHLTPDEVHQLGEARAFVCACPSTEKNLGDGVVPADQLLHAGARICLGTDSQAEMDLLAEARQLEGHLRLVRGRRAVLDDGASGPEGLATRLLRCATESGAASLGVQAGTLAEGMPLDAFTVDLNHPSLAGLSSTQALSGVLFGGVAGIVREVWVQGEQHVRDGHHALEAESHRAFGALARRVFA